MTHTVQIVGIPWYRREDYPRLRKIFADGNKLSPTYQEWLNLAQQTKKRLEGNGMRVVEAHIDPATFPAWCKSKGLNVDAQCRMEFANLAAADAYRKET